MARKNSTLDEQTVNHYGAVRLRVNGSAQLQLSLFSFDESLSTILVPIPLQATTAVEPNRLSNFTQQRAKLMIRTFNIYETFQISKIIVFVKPVAKSFPETT
jgi:hypothetical protein